MWHAITRLLNEQLGAGEISQRTELPGGEIHAAWRIDWAGRAIFVKCDDSTLLPCFTAEADQLNLLARSKTVTVPEVLGVGSDREYSFLLLEYLPPKPLDAHNAFLLGQQLARLHQWSEQPQYGLDYDNHLSTTPQPNAWQRRWASFFAEQRIGWQLELAAEKGMEFGDIDRIVDAVHQQLVSHQRAFTAAWRFVVRQLRAGAGRALYFRPGLLLGRSRMRFSDAAAAPGTAAADL